MAGNLQIISKLYSKIDVLSIALAWPSIILPVVREIIHIKKVWKRVILE